MSAVKSTILIVDDEVSNIEIMGAVLGDDYDICFATSGREALEVARRNLPDLVLLDIIMPGIQGFEVCQLLKADPLLSDVPVIFTTALNETQNEAHGLAIGAIDYVIKPIQPSILRSRVKNHIALKQMRDNLAEMAERDSLTGLHNRRKLDRHLQEMLTNLAAQSGWLAVIMMDIDHFKQFNDTYGHIAGDNCIRLVASALQPGMLGYPIFSARYGGEEFACILPGADEARALSVAKSIQAAVAHLAVPHATSLVSHHATLSLGVIAGRPHAGMQGGDWLEAADRLMYRAKKTGRNRICAALLRESTPSDLLPDGGGSHSRRPASRAEARTVSKP